MNEVSNQNIQTSRRQLLDYCHVNRKAYQQSRTGVTVAISGLSSQPRTGTRQAIRGRNTNDENNTRIKLGSWNVDTMRQRAYKVVETMERRNIDMYCVFPDMTISGNISKYNFFWNGDETGY